MPDSKITALASTGTGTDPANDPLVIVDVSDTSMAASGTTKKVTLNNLLACSPTATLASATITGDLTVDTNVLKVNTTTNRVGINTTTPTQNLQITGSGDPLTVDGCSAIKLTNTVSGRAAIVGLDDSQNFIVWNVGTEVSETIKFLTGGGSGKEQYRITHGGVFTWYDGAGGTRMTLNSTGLGVGRTPATYKFEVLGNAQVIQSNFTDVAFRISQGASTSGNKAQLLFTDSSGTIGNITSYGSAYGGGVSGALAIGTGGTDRLTVDSSGNVGIGVTPSAWSGLSAKVIEFGSSVSNNSLWGNGVNDVHLVSNSYFNGSSWIYNKTASATRYNQLTGSHAWYSAPSGTAGNAVTWTQAMTLDASGNLLVAKTSTSDSVVGALLGATGSISCARTSSSNTDLTYIAYSTGASAYRFYVGLGGTVFATNTTISAISDARFKENVQDIDVGLGAILALKPRKFDWKAGKGKDIKGDRGFIAQEFEQVFPQLVDEWKDNAPEGEAPYKSVRQDLIPVLVKAIQELAAEVNALKNA